MRDVNWHDWSHQGRYMYHKSLLVCVKGRGRNFFLSNKFPLSKPYFRLAEGEERHFLDYF